MSARRKSQKRTLIWAFWALKAGLITLVMAGVPALWASQGVAQPLRIDAGPPMALVNDSTVVLENVRCGSVTAPTLAPKASLILPDGCTDEPVARIKLSDWGKSLETVSESFAPYHLRTAGHLLDAVDMGPSGEPLRSANIMVLAQMDPGLAKEWVQGDALRLGLVARASEYAPVELLSELIAKTQPTTTAPSWPAAYSTLPAISESIRTAIRRHGLKSLPAILGSPAWAKDRGFSDPRLALAFDGMQTHVHFATQGVAVRPPLSFKARVREFTRAQNRGDLEELARLGLDAALHGDKPRVSYPRALEQRLACGGLDAGAHISIRKRHYLAALAYLSLAVIPCGDSAPIRSRIAELFRHMGDQAFEKLRLKTASDWFEGALWFAGEAVDRARLADTQAELAIFRFREGHDGAGARFLARAKEISPLRPRVLEAGQFKPTVDPRARFAVIVIILFLGFFALRRLKRAVFDVTKK